MIKRKNLLFRLAHFRELRIFRFLGQDVPTLVGFVIILFVILTAVFPQLFAPDDPYMIHGKERLLPPSKKHLFGTDELGRDLFSRVVYGSRISLRAGFLATAFAALIGITLGVNAGYWGGIIEVVVMRLGDIFMSFPALVIAMAIVAALGAGLENTIIAIGIVWWPGYARLSRIEVASTKMNTYVEAARACGTGTGRLILRHILPNCMSSMVVKATLDIGYVILIAAALSFVGLGVKPPTPEWGCLVTFGRVYLLDHWWYATFPGVAIFMTVLGFNLLGDGLRDFLDPRLKR